MSRTLALAVAICFVSGHRVPGQQGQEIAGLELDRLCAAIARVGEIADEMQSRRATIPLRPFTAFRILSMRIQESRARSAFVDLQELKRRGRIRSAFIADFRGWSWMRTPTARCEPATEPGPSGSIVGYRKYNDPELTDDTILIERLMLGTGDAFAQGTPSPDALAVLLIHEHQRVTRSACYFQAKPSTAPGGLPEPPLEGDWEWTTYRQVTCGESVLDLLDILLVYELQDWQDGLSEGDPDHWSGEQAKFIERIKRSATKNLQKNIRLKGEMQ